MSEAMEEIQRLRVEVKRGTEYGEFMNTQTKELNKQLEGMTEARDRFCGSLNRLADIVGLSGKQCFAPEAVERKAKFELATLRERVKDLEGKRFPIQGGPSIPWSMIGPHDRQCVDNHSQTLERLAERGGLSPSEVLAVLDDVRWFKSKWRTTSEAECHDELERRRAAFEDESIALRRLLSEAAEATGIAGVDKPMTLEECILSLRKERDGLKGFVVTLEGRVGDCAEEVLSLEARLKAAEKEVETVNANWDADRQELEESLANTVPLSPDENEVSQEMLMIVHEIMHCDEKTLPGGLCQCTRYIRAQFEGLRAEIKRLQAKVQYAKDFGLEIGVVKSSDCPEGKLGCNTREGSELHRLEMGIADLIESQAEVLRLKKAAVECDFHVLKCPVLEGEDITLLDPVEAPLEEEDV